MSQQLLKSCALLPRRASGIVQIRTRSAIAEDIPALVPRGRGGRIACGPVLVPRLRPVAAPTPVGS